LNFGLKNGDDKEVSGKSELLSLIIEQRNKSGKINILEQLLDKWYSDEKGKTKVLVFSQTKIILNIVGKILEEKQMKYKVRNLR
jgi:SNF2 family DNA or RNA helicase